MRAIMFTDIVGSTSMTECLGDARSVEMVRAHDALVRRALKDQGGQVVKHTGDGIMASFADAAASVQCARSIQQAFEAFNLASKEKLQVRIGIDVGEPIADSNDLFVRPFNSLLACASCRCLFVLSWLSGPFEAAVSGPLNVSLPRCGC